MTNTIADAIFWIAVATCTLAQVAILRSIFNPAPKGAPASALPGRPVRRATERVWAALPAVGLAVVLALTWREMQRGRQAPIDGHSTHSSHAPHAGHPATPTRTGESVHSAPVTKVLP